MDLYSCHWREYSLILAIIKVCAAPKGMVLHHSGLKTGKHFAHFGLESATAFKGTTGMDDQTHCSFQFQMSKKERERL